MLNDINTILKLTNVLKIISFLKAAMTVGIIAFTAFRIYKMLKLNTVAEIE